MVTASRSIPSVNRPCVNERVEPLDGTRSNESALAILVGTGMTFCKLLRSLFSYPLRVDPLYDTDLDQYVDQRRCKGVTSIQFLHEVLKRDGWFLFHSCAINGASSAGFA